MKNLYLIIFGLFFIQIKASEIDTISINSEIKKVTVYPFGADITRKASVELPKGQIILKFDHLPFEIEEDNLIIGSSDLNLIGSIKLNHIQGRQKGKSKAIKNLEKEIQKRITLSKNIKDEANILDKNNLILLNHSTVNNEKGLVSLTDLEKATSYYNKAFKRMNKERQMFKTKLRQYSQEVDSLQNLIQIEIKKHSSNYTEVYVFADVKQATKADFSIGYFLKSAGWSPKYNFKIQNVNSPMTVDFRADIFQLTGEDWDNTEITLSPTEPLLTKQKPEYKPYIFENGVSNTKVKKNFYGKINGVIGNATDGEILSESKIDILQNGGIIKSILSSTNGTFNINPLKVGLYEIKISHQGFRSEIKRVTVKQNAPVNLEVGLEKENGILVLEEEIEQKAVRGVAGLVAQTAGISRADQGSSFMVRGGRSTGTVYFVDGVKVMGSPGIVNSRSTYYKKKVKTDDFEKMIANTTYKVNPIFNIKSNGESYNVKIKTTKIKADYEYYIMPQYQPFAYVQSVIPNWQQYNFTSGDATIYFENKLIGKAFLDTETIQDTLKLQLGKDEQIVVQRKSEILNNSGVFLSGNKTKLEKKCTTVIKSHKEYPIQVKLIDQYPITESHDIDITLIENGGAKVDSKSGKLVWNLKIKPKMKDEVSFKYHVKYPESIKMRY